MHIIHIFSYKTVVSTMLVCIILQYSIIHRGTPCFYESFLYILIPLTLITANTFLAPWWWMAKIFSKFPWKIWCHILVTFPYHLEQNYSLLIFQKIILVYKSTIPLNSYTIIKRHLASISILHCFSTANQLMECALMGL